MLTFGLFIVLTAVALPSVSATPAHLTRVTVLIFLSSAALSANAYNWEGLGSGLGLSSGLIDLTGQSLFGQMPSLIVGSLALVQWAPFITSYPGAFPLITTYPLFALLSAIGGCLLLASGDLVTFYLALELQSFAVYVLAALYRDNESATHSGLMYFLLGGLSSCLILLGFAVIYNQTGITNIESLVMFISVMNTDNLVINYSLALGFTSVISGLMFKVTAAPFHNWGPDVYDGVPTIVTTWIAVVPKISLLMLFFTLSNGFINTLVIINDTTSYDVWSILLQISSILSLIIGSIVGLAQQRIKRLLAYSTISHVGFMLLAISINTPEASSGFIFYLIQYTLTAILSFSLISAINYDITILSRQPKDISLISELKGLQERNMPIAISLLVVLFSLAGVPPLIGFYGKLEVLSSAISGHYYFISIIAVLSSIISAAYYLNVIRVSWFNNSSKNLPFIPFSNGSLIEYFYHNIFISKLSNTYTTTELISIRNNDIVGSRITNVQSYVISLLTLILGLYIISPTLLINTTHLLVLSIYSI